MRAPPLAPVVGIGLVVVALALASYNSHSCEAANQTHQLGGVGWLPFAGVFTLGGFVISRINSRQVQHSAARWAAIGMTALGGLVAFIVLGNVAAIMQNGLCIPW